MVEFVLFSNVPCDVLAGIAFSFSSERVPLSPVLSYVFLSWVFSHVAFLFLFFPHMVILCFCYIYVIPLFAVFWFLMRV